MSSHYDHFVCLARKIQDHIVGFALGNILLQDDMRSLRIVAYQADRRLGVDIDTRHFLTAADIASKFLQINVLIRIVGVAVVGNDADCAVLQQIMVCPVANAAVKHDNFATALGKRASSACPRQKQNKSDMVN